MANKITINDAAQVVIDTEIAALTEIKTILDTVDAQLAAVADSLPSALTLDASRILSEIRGAFSYRRTMDIPQILARYTPPAAINYVPEAS